MNKSTKWIVVSVIITGVIIGGVFLLSGKDNNQNNTQSTSVLGTSSGGQVIQVTANSRGYSPTMVTAKANTPTTLHITSSNAYGCERSFQILSLNTSKVLPENGTTDIDLGTQKAGTTITATCSMGMYRVVIKFN